MMDGTMTDLLDRLDPVRVDWRHYGDDSGGLTEKDFARSLKASREVIAATGGRMRTLRQILECKG